MIYFTVYGEPKGKGRPRFTKNGHTYTPDSTVKYEKSVKKKYKEQCHERYDKGVGLKMVVCAYYKIQKNISKKERADKLSGRIRPTKKPDADNILKIIADSLNGLAYHDDAQIVYAKVEKYYSDEPRVSVRIEELQEEQT